MHGLGSLCDHEMKLWPIIFCAMANYMSSAVLLATGKDKSTSSGFDIRQAQKAVKSYVGMRDFILTKSKFSTSRG